MDMAFTNTANHMADLIAPLIKSIIDKLDDDDFATKVRTLCGNPISTESEEKFKETVLNDETLNSEEKLRLFSLFEEEKRKTISQYADVLEKHNDQKLKRFLITTGFIASCAIIGITIVRRRGIGCIAPIASAII